MRVRVFPPMNEYVGVLMKKAILLIPVICSISLLGGCSKPKEDTKKKEQAQLNTDEAISRKVRNALKNEPTLSKTARKVTVSTLDGVVTLSGNVTSNNERRSVIKIAKTVPGIKRIRDQMVLGS